MRGRLTATQQWKSSCCSLFYFLLSKCESSRSKAKIKEKTPHTTTTTTTTSPIGILSVSVSLLKCTSLLYSSYITHLKHFICSLCFDAMPLSCYIVCCYLTILLLLNPFYSICLIMWMPNPKKINLNIPLCTQSHVQHHPAPPSWRRTASSSTNCPTWAAPGSKPLAMRPRLRGPWPPCELKAPSPSPSPCMSPVDLMALSGQ